MKPRIVGENGEGSPIVGSFSNWKLRWVERASASMSFSETSNMTSWPRSRSTSATAIPGKRCPPVPPHAITVFIRVGFPLLADLSAYRTHQSHLNSRCYPRVHRDTFFMRWFKNALSINIQQQANPKHASDEI